MMARFLAWLFSWWADREQIRQQAERARLDAVLRWTDPQYTAQLGKRYNAPPRAAGMKHRRIG